jgi:hypothetical protein
MKRLYIVLVFVMLTGLGSSAQVSQSKADPTQESTSTPVQNLRFIKLLQIAPVFTKGFPRLPLLVVWSPDAHYLAVGYQGDEYIRILDGVTGAERFTLQSPGFVQYFSLVWSPSGKYLAGSFNTVFNSPLKNSKGVIRVWEISTESARILSTFTRPPANADPLITWSTDETKLAGSSWSHEQEIDSLRIWNVKDGALLTERENMSIDLWSPDGRKMLIAIPDNEDKWEIQIVDGETLKPLLKFPKQDAGRETSVFINSWSGNSRYVAGISYGPEGDNLVSRIWTWNVEMDSFKDDFEGADNLINRIGTNTFGLNSSGTLISAVLWNNIYFWNVETGELHNPLQINKEGGDISENIVSSVSWQQSKNIIALGNGDGSIQVWEIDYSE